MRRRDALAVILPILAACEDDPTALDEADAFAKDLAETLCDDAVPCCLERQLALPGDSCRATMRNEVFIELIEAETERRAIDYATRDHCIGVFRGAMRQAPTCEELPSPGSIRRFCPELFGPVPQGDKTPGEKCEAAHECSGPDEGTFDCVEEYPNGPRSCQWYAAAEPGGRCGFVDVGVWLTCPEGTGCAPPTPGGEPICGQQRAEGQPCFDRTTCISSLECEDDGDGVYRCLRRIALGDQCLTRPDGCEAGARCDLVEGVCEPLPIVACEAGNCPSILGAYCAP